MNSITIHAPAKINLTLDVTGVRPNGYHEVRMVMQTIGLYDRIDLKKTPEREGILLDLANPFASLGAGTAAELVPCDEHNLAYKAAVLFFDKAAAKGIRPEGIRILITKNIPVAAGMAGGSTDGAGVLRGLNKLYGEPFSTEELLEMSPLLGADVAFCVMGGTALSEGIGEVLTPLPSAAGLKLLVAKPDISVSTAEVYGLLDARPIQKHPDTESMIDAIRQRDERGIAGCLGNVLADVTMPLHPEIGRIRDLMLEYGALGALMSGSGPTVFGIYERNEDIEKACGALMDLGYTQVFMTATTDMES